MTADQFEQVFSPSIRVMYNWHRHRKLQPAVQLEVVDRQAALGTLMLPWTFDGTLMSRRAKRFSVEKQARNLPVGEHGAMVLDFAARFAREQHVSLMLPALSMEGGKRFLLDGCHRVVALFVSSISSFRVALFCVELPQDAGTLVDLSLETDR